MLVLPGCQAPFLGADATDNANDAAPLAGAPANGESRRAATQTYPPDLPFDYAALVAQGDGIEPQVVNGGVPFFSEAELTLDAREDYAPLDVLGRCGRATMLVGPETVPTTPRPDISAVTPSGWVQARYDFIAQSNGALYNRSHLVARSLGGADEAVNLVTGTARLNQELMDAYEEQARAQVRAGRHVLWRVTPVFEGDDLLARGVLVEGRSIEDGGAGLCVCAWCPNAQPGVEIDYATGESRAAGDGVGTASDARETSAGEGGVSQVRYVLNARSKVYHLPGTPCAGSIAERNRRESNEDAAALEAKGYRPCGSCHPERAG